MVVRIERRYGMKSLRPTTVYPEVKKMKGNILAWRLIGVFLGTMLTLSLVRGVGAGSFIRLLSPKPGSVLKGEVTLQAVVESPEVSYVVFGVDETRPHSTNSAPYRYLLDSELLDNGAHSLFVEAYSRGGLLGRSAPVRVVVKNYSEARPLIAEPKIEIMVNNPLPKTKTEPTPSAAAVGKTRPPAGAAPMLSAEPKLSSEMIAAPQLALDNKPAPAYLAAPVPQANQLPVPTPASESPAFFLNGRAIAWDETMAIENGRLQAGFRKIMEAAGWKVEWIAGRKAGVATAGEYRMEVVLGDDRLYFGGNPYSLGEKARLSQNRLVVPLRPICEAGEMTLVWDKGAKTLRLISPYLALASMKESSIIAAKQ
jgi:hypothetical protein